MERTGAAGTAWMTVPSEDIAAADRVEPGPVAKPKALLSLLRPPQWIKNGFVLAPLFFTPQAVSSHTATRVLLGMLCFCLISSCVYIVNDLSDREADRSHPGKCRRPLVTGAVSTAEALVLLALLCGVGFAGAVSLSGAFALVLALYFSINLAYSFGLKHRPIIDLLAISAGFVLRVDAGARLIHVQPSEWIMICTGFLALFLAIAKRRDDLVKDVGTGHRPSLKGYNTRYLDVAATVVLGALLVSYAIYTTDNDVMARLGSERLYLTVPFVLAGILRYLQIALVEERSGSPTTIVLTDRFMIVTILGWIAAFAALIYG